MAIFEGRPFELLLLLFAAGFEVAGDAMIRAGFRHLGWPFAFCGFMVLGTYGLLVNSLSMDFSRMLGTYVAFFALVSVLAGRFVFQETIPTSTWVGVLVICVGSAIVQGGV